MKVIEALNAGVLHVSCSADMTAINSPLQCARNPGAADPIVPSIVKLRDVTLVSVYNLSRSIRSRKCVVDRIAKLTLIVTLHLLGLISQCLSDDSKTACSAEYEPGRPM